MVDQKERKTKQDYKFFHEISTRWNDNDVRWHMNNAKYYEFFDTVIGKMLFGIKGLDLKEDSTIFVTAETGCTYYEEISFPDRVIAGLKIKYLGSSSVQYDIGLFKNNNESISARGHFVHVLIDRKTKKPINIPLQIKTSLEVLL